MVRRADTALLLRRFPFGESSLVVHAATRSHGSVHLLAKGAYRPTSRYYAALDLFDTLELEWQESPGRELSNLVAATIGVRRHRLAHDLERYKASLSVLELADLGSQEGPANIELFELASRALDQLLSPCPAELTLVEFELAFLHNLGLAPALLECAACAGPAPAAVAGGSPRVAFSAQGGGRLCLRCAGEARAHGRRVGTLPESVLLHAARLTGSPAIQPNPNTAKEARLDTRSLTLVHDAVARFLEHQLQGRPKSYRTFLAGPQRNTP
ncbi:MAG TPA: DNA repair protein RecO [Planctomycetota bacterium]|nr:DNA repair protein RecO [Planctomycetota bacterium]